jgi:hypothetical protein
MKKADEPTTATAAAAATLDGSDVAHELDLARARRGNFLPTDPTERARVLEARVRALQRSGLRFRDALEAIRDMPGVDDDPHRTALAMQECARRALAE